MGGCEKRVDWGCMVSQGRNKLNECSPRGTHKESRDVAHGQFTQDGLSRQSQLLLSRQSQHWEPNKHLRYDKQGGQKPNCCCNQSKRIILLWKKLNNHKSTTCEKCNCCYCSLDLRLTCQIRVCCYFDCGDPRSYK